MKEKPSISKGPKGEMTLEVHDSVSFTQEENSIQVKWQKDEERAMAGTMRALDNNYVKGVGEGFEKNIKLNGVGYRAKVQGKKITFTFRDFLIQLTTNCLKRLKQNKKTKQRLHFHLVINSF